MFKNYLKFAWRNILKFRMLTGGFLKLICLSFVLAFPIAYYLVREWLQDFAFRIDIPWWVFITAAVLIILLAMATISLRSIKAALSNPVEALRNE